MLVVAAEDYTGASPVQDPAGPHFVTRTPTPWPPTASRPTSTTSTPPAGWRPTRSACSATTTPSSGRPATTWSPAPPAAVGGNADRLALDELLEARCVHERGRQGPLSQATPPVSSTPWRSCTTPRVRSPATRRSRGHRPAALPALVRLVLRWRRHQRRAAVLAGWLRCRGQRRSRRRRRVRLDRGGRPVHGPRVGSRRSRLRRQHRSEVVVPRDERHPADRPVRAVRELARGAVRQAGRPVRPTHRNPVRLLADRRRLLQEAHPRDRRTGSWWVDDVLDVVRHRGRVGPPVRGGAHSRR